MKTGIGPHDQLRLHLFGELVWEAWGEISYRVGSSVRGEPWRDIDVRVMIEDSEYDQWFGPDCRDDNAIANPQFRSHMLAWSRLGAEMTGLPIDFQVQRSSEASTLFSGMRRDPIGLWRNSLREKCEG